MKKDNENDILAIAVIGIIITNLFLGYVEKPDVFDNLSFGEAVLEIIGQIFTSAGYCLLVALASIIAFGIYFAATSNVEKRKTKVIFAIGLIILAIILFAFLVTA